MLPASGTARRAVEGADVRTILTALTLFFALALAPAQSSAAGQPEFAPGQEWTVRNSPIHVVIGRVEKHTDGRGGDRTIVHVSLFHIPCSPDFGCQAIDAGHMPFVADALAQSVDTLVGTSAETSALFEDG